MAAFLSKNQRAHVEHTALRPRKVGAAPGNEGWVLELVQRNPNNEVVATVHTLCGWYQSKAQAEEAAFTVLDALNQLGRWERLV